MPTLPPIPFVLAQAADAAPPAPSKSLFDYIQAGGTIGYVIILLSIVAVALIIIHFLRVRIARLAPPNVVGALDRMLRQNDTDGAMAYCAHPDNECVITRMFGAALSRCAKSPFGMLELRSALEEAGQEQIARLHRSVDPVAVIAAVAPMLGLLGTVVGMVGAFDTIAGSQGFARPDQLAGYISLALITTVMGLIVAIPCTATVSAMRNRIDHMAGDIAAIVEELSSHLHAGSEAAPPPPPERRPATRPSAPSQPVPAGKIGA